ncbi:MAG: hypothetical protein DMG64_16105 [Acidobacteria bacterium]|nr:MAG: hypothetical protein DMG63_10015 [Acidobacteriota bacterium]PYY00811.1 MAG: hypothetical protein DMG64_16105 [Acidobacteriota bacterium]PYY24352.1 MAG: hypothetical protein DMG62_03415 [Acidobacteriota bacterium]
MKIGVSAPLDAPAADDFERKLVLQRLIRRSHIREIAWLSVAVAEVTLLVVLRLNAALIYLLLVVSGVRPRLGWVAVPPGLLRTLNL